MPHITKLPRVGRIQGVVLVPGDTPNTGICTLGYDDPTGTSHEVEIPIADALYLLNLLRQMERDGNLRQANRETHEVIEGRVTRVGAETTANVKPTDRRIALEVDDTTDSSKWLIRVSMPDARFVRGEIGRIAKQLGLPPGD